MKRRTIVAGMALAALRPAHATAKQPAPLRAGDSVEQARTKLEAALLKREMLDVLPTLHAMSARDAHMMTLNEDDLLPNDARDAEAAIAAAMRNGQQVTTVVFGIKRPGLLQSDRRMRIYLGHEDGRVVSLLDVESYPK